MTMSRWDEDEKSKLNLGLSGEAINKVISDNFNDDEKIWIFMNLNNIKVVYYKKLKLISYFLKNTWHLGTFKQINVIYWEGSGVNGRIK